MSEPTHPYPPSTSGSDAASAEAEARAARSDVRRGAPGAAAADAAANGAPRTRAPRPFVDYRDEMRIHRNPALRGAYVAAGLTAVGLGALGYVLPGLPGTVFFLLAAWFFAQSSPRFYNWLMNHRLFGPLIRDYRAGKGVPLWVKVYAPAMIVLFSGASATYLGWVKGKAWIAVLVLAVAAYGVVFVLRLPTKKAAPRPVD